MSLKITYIQFEEMSYEEQLELINRVSSKFIKSFTKGCTIKKDSDDEFEEEIVVGLHITDQDDESYTLRFSV